MVTRLCAAAASVALALFVAGCSPLNDPVNPDQPWTPPAMTGTEPLPSGSGLDQELPPPSNSGGEVVQGLPPIDSMRTPGSTEAAGGAPSILQVQDLVKVTFSDINPAPPPHEQRIRDDGTITLPLNVRVRAVGLTPGELETAIRKEYVPKYYNYLTVTVRTDERVYFVGGEVRNPSRQLYIGNMTVTRAIDTAGGFTEYANRGKIELLRSTGKKFRINYDKAVRKPELDLEVFPGDRIYVPKRGVFGN